MRAVTEDDRIDFVSKYPKINISKVDSDAGSPKLGDMIRRDPRNHDMQWLVAARHFAGNFELVDAAPARALTLVGEIDEEELGMRMVKALREHPVPPPHATRDERTDSFAEGTIKMARAAIKYFREIVEAKALH